MASRRDIENSDHTACPSVSYSLPVRWYRLLGHTWGNWEHSAAVLGSRASEVTQPCQGIWKLTSAGTCPARKPWNSGWVSALVSPTLASCTDPGRAGTHRSAKGCVKPELRHYVNPLYKQATGSAALRKWSKPEVPQMTLDSHLPPSPWHVPLTVFRVVRTAAKSFPKMAPPSCMGGYTREKLNMPRGTETTARTSLQQEHWEKQRFTWLRAPFQTLDNTSKEPKQGKPQALPFFGYYSAIIQVCQPVAVPS